MAGIGYRFSFYKLLPKFLTEGESELVAFSLGVIKDAFLERCRQSLMQRFPSYAGDAALALIGAERGIPRGRTEAKAHYVTRLKAWRYPRGHRTRGSAFALLEQVSEYWGGLLAITHDDKGNEHGRAADGTESFAYTSWNWDGGSIAHSGSKWSRFWLEIHPQPYVPTIKAWPSWHQAFGGTTWGAATKAGYTFGQQGVLAGDSRALQGLFKARGLAVSWKPAGTTAMYAVVVLEPVGGPTTVDPAGLWGDPRGRATTAPSVIRFWRLTP
jgi:hypothetical protein